MVHLSSDPLDSSSCSSVPFPATIKTPPYIRLSRIACTHIDTSQLPKHVGALVHIGNRNIDLTSVLLYSLNTSLPLSRHFSQRWFLLPWRRLPSVATSTSTPWKAHLQVLTFLPICGFLYIQDLAARAGFLGGGLGRLNRHGTRWGFWRGGV